MSSGKEFADRPFADITVVEGEIVDVHADKAIDGGLGSITAIPHRVFDGNRPSNVLMAEKLTPATLGRLVSFYEMSVFTQGVIWNINSFDQWGVELGKALAQRIIPELEAPTDTELKHDSSTNSLIRRYRKMKAV